MVQVVDSLVDEELVVVHVVDELFFFVVEESGHVLEDVLLELELELDVVV